MGGDSNRLFTRREFLRGCAFCGACIALGPLTAIPIEAAPAHKRRLLYQESLKEARYWQPLPDNRTRCTTCPNFCERGPGEITFCKTRINVDGKLYTRTHSLPCVLYNDPLEKNPLYHVAPGSLAIATATAGCNLRCTYCQNWEIAQVGPDKTRNMNLTPLELVKKVQQRGFKWLTFAYTEPVAYYEYALDAAKIAKERGVKVAIVTAGYINPKPLDELIKQADAFSVTMKGYTKEFYREVCAAELDCVWKTIATIVRSGRWLEVVTLIVPGLNDEEWGLRSIARSVAALNKNIPLHFLRFSPAYKLRHLPPTPLRTLERAHKIAVGEGLRYVYLSNLPGHRSTNTYCPGCKRTLIERVGFKILSNRVKRDRCPYCGYLIAGRMLG